MGMTGFICQDTYLAKTAKLSDEEVGRLFRALMKYHAREEYEELDGRESIAFDFIREDIDKADEAYDRKCEQAKINRSKGIQPKSTEVNSGQRPSTAVKKPRPKSNVSELFETFWSEYPRHVAKAKALSEFEKINPDQELLQKMIQAVRKQKQSEQWHEDNGRYIPHPATWLHQKRWEDEPQKVRKVVAQDFDQRDYDDVPNEILDDLAKEMAAFKQREGIG